MVTGKHWAVYTHTHTHITHTHTHARARIQHSPCGYKFCRSRTSSVLVVLMCVCVRARACVCVCVYTQADMVSPGLLGTWFEFGMRHCMSPWAKQQNNGQPTMLRNNVPVSERHTHTHTQQERTRSGGLAYCIVQPNPASPPARPPTHTHTHTHRTAPADSLARLGQYAFLG